MYELNKRSKLILISLYTVTLSLFPIIGNAQDPQSREYFILGYRKIDEGKYDKAIEYFHKAIELDSTGECGMGKHKGVAHSELGFSYLFSGDTVNAMKYLELATSLDPTNPLPIQNLVIILVNNEKYDEALATLERVINIDPDFATAFAQRGFIYETLNQPDLALENFKKSLEFNKGEFPAQMVKTIRKAIKEIERSKD